MSKLDYVKDILFGVVVIGGTVLVGWAVALALHALAAALQR